MANKAEQASFYVCSEDFDQDLRHWREGGLKRLVDSNHVRICETKVWVSKRDLAWWQWDQIQKTIAASDVIVKEEVPLLTPVYEFLSDAQLDVMRELMGQAPRSKDPTEILAEEVFRMAAGTRRLLRETRELLQAL